MFLVPVWVLMAPFFLLVVLYALCKKPLPRWLWYVCSLSGCVLVVVISMTEVIGDLSARIFPQAPGTLLAYAVIPVVISVFDATYMGQLNSRR